MLLTVLISLIFVALIAGLIVGAILIRRHQRDLKAKRESAQLQRRADHLFKIALAAQVHTRSNAIARTLLEEALRVLNYSLHLDPRSELAMASLRECHDLLGGIEAETETAAQKGDDPALDFPETELIEAQLHLTEASRLLIGLEKKGQISYDAHAQMAVAIKQGQRALELRLQLQRATHAITAGDHSPPKFDETLANEYLASVERNQARSSL
ncbi:MAG: hypothetical protein QM709_14335 [Spongiibacteraceae bacterium]